MCRTPVLAARHRISAAGETWWVRANRWEPKEQSVAEEEEEPPPEEEAPPPKCAACGGPGSFPCNGCSSAAYCSAPCQQKDWALRHRQQCKRLRRLQPRAAGPAHGRSGARVAAGAVPAAAAPPRCARPQESNSTPPVPKHVLFPYADFKQLLQSVPQRKAPVGLVNVGNSCYANSLLQALLATPALASYLVSGRHTESCVKPSPSDWCALCELQGLAQAAYRDGGDGPARRDAISPLPLLKHVRRLGRQFCFGQQEDSHELYVRLVEAMEQIQLAEAGGRARFDLRSQVGAPRRPGFRCGPDICRVLNRRCCPSGSPLPLPCCRAGGADVSYSWLPDPGCLSPGCLPACLLQETTLTHHTFSGYLRSQIDCLRCGGVSRSYEACVGGITLEVPALRVAGLEAALRGLTAVERLDGENSYKCDACNDYVAAERSSRVEVAPNVLCICLKRFAVRETGHGSAERLGCSALLLLLGDAVSALPALLKCGLWPSLQSG